MNGLKSTLQGGTNVSDLTLSIGISTRFLYGTAWKKTKPSG